jgi:ATP-dependent DNA helicase RecQ
MLPGRTVARLTDLGWGQRLRAVLAEDAPASEELLAACVGVLRDWDWAERPVGVVAMPSRGRPQLVGSVASGLAAIGRLDFLGTLDLVDGGPTGEPGGNSAFRLAGVWGRFSVGPALSEALTQTSGPVLLVDDVVDSRWTMTVAARTLRQAGADAVLPVALAAQS